ncbi:MAG: OprD family outer membrane porin [Chitinophagaceae bacterium]|nr:OprD family outer membrane porin [Chitinophagaceae bacterium]
MPLVRFFLILLLTSGALTLFAQHQELSDQPGLWRGQKGTQGDTLSLLSAFKRGIMQGHFRYFFMATDNARPYRDYYAHAIGGGIKYETASFHGFRLGVSGFFAFNIGSSNLSDPDPLTGQMNRYEIGLFDIENPANRNDIDRLEELYLQYEKKKTSVRVGRQLLNTPFINLQDGRMRPTEVSGVWAETKVGSNTRLQAGFLYKVSPRSTVNWYDIGSSIGVYPTGVNPNGQRSGYAGEIKSKGILLLGLNHKWPGGTQVKIWNQFTENVFNTTLVQADWKVKDKAKTQWLAGIQFIQQNAIKSGGNADPAHTYYEPRGQARTFGARIGLELSRWETNLNYNRITAAGRYLMPREWGREPFFTFMPRERNEGFGDVHALVLRLGYKIPAQRIKLAAAVGYFDLPDVKNYALNKYGVPSYTQLNLDLRYEFGGWLQGLDAQLLAVYKARTGPAYGEGKYIVNKVDMLLWNLVFNFHF